MHAIIAHGTKHMLILPNKLANNHTAPGLFQRESNSVVTWRWKFVLAAIVTPSGRIKKYVIAPYISIYFGVVFYSNVEFVFR